MMEVHDGWVEGSRLVRFAQPKIVDEVQMNPLGRKRTKEGECGVCRGRMHLVFQSLS